MFFNKLKSYNISIKSEDEILFLIDDDEKIYVKTVQTFAEIDKFKKFLYLCDNEIELSEDKIIEKIHNKLKDVNRHLHNKLEKMNESIQKSKNDNNSKLFSLVEKVEIEEEILFKYDTTDLRITEFTTCEKIILTTILWEIKAKHMTSLGGIKAKHYNCRYDSRKVLSLL